MFDVYKLTIIDPVYSFIAAAVQIQETDDSSVPRPACTAQLSTATPRPTGELRRGTRARAHSGPRTRQPSPVPSSRRGMKE